jgi:esterase
MERFLFLSALACTAISAIGQSAQPYPMGTLHESGQGITGAFEGWFKNSDGTFSILLGYFNRNAKEELDIPIGPDNSIEPGGPDQGQPVHFLAGRQWGVFTVTVPKDFGSSNKLTWTLTANGRTNVIPLSLNPLWEVSPFKEEGIGNTPPFISFEKGGPTIQGPRSLRTSMTASLGDPLPLTVWVSDDAKTAPGAQPQRTPPVTITWSQFRGPAKVVFANTKPAVVQEAANGGTVFSGEASTTATFSQPGEYVLHVVANDWSGDGGRGFQCCWTNGEVTVTVSPTAAAYTDRFITVNGLKLHYLDWGNENKPPFIMLHGISRVAHQFDHLAQHFKGDYHVMAIDMRGHGDSEWSPEGAYLVEDYVQDLEAFVDKLDLHGLTLLGNSTGGRVVQVYAGLHPDRVARLISEDVGPERTNDIASAFTRQVEQEKDGWASEDELFASLKRTNAKTPEEILRAYVHFGSKRREDGRIVWKRDPNLAKGFVPTELWQYVRNIKCPTIYILGGNSRIVPPETQQKLKETIPGVQVVVIPETGHYPDQEASGEFLLIAQAFLAGTRP